MKTAKNQNCVHNNYEIEHTIGQGFGRVSEQRNGNGQEKGNRGDEEQKDGIFEGVQRLSGSAVVVDGEDPLCSCNHISTGILIVTNSALVRGSNIGKDSGSFIIATLE